MESDDKHKEVNPTAEPEMTILPGPSIPIPLGGDLSSLQLDLSPKELACLQQIMGTDVGLQHLRQQAAQEGIDLPSSQELPLSQESFGEIATVQPEFPIPGLVLLVKGGNTTVDSGDKEDWKVNKEYLLYDFKHGKFPLKSNSWDSSWSKEIHVLSQARMAAYTSNSLIVHALQCGFHLEWLHALGLKQNMSLISDDMNQSIKLDNGSTLHPYTWLSDNLFPDDDGFGYANCDLSFVVEGLWNEFPYLRGVEDFPYPHRLKCGTGKSGSHKKKPKFGIYYGVPGHQECGLPVTTLGIIQGSLHMEGVHAIYAQEVSGSFHWTTTKTCAWCNWAFSNGESAMNHMRVHYRIVLVCPMCRQ